MNYNRIAGFIAASWILSFTSPGFAAPGVAAIAAGNLQPNLYRLTINTQRGEQREIEILGFSHEVQSPRDAASGLPTGKRQHKPFTVTKFIDNATPLLNEVLVDRENITTWEMTFWRPSRKGREYKLYKTVKLIGPVISGVANDSPVGSNLRHAEREHVAFTYQKIQWAYHPSGVVVEDEWQVEDEE